MVVISLSRRFEGTVGLKKDIAKLEVLACVQNLKD